VVGPEPQGAGELDLPDRDQPDAYLQLAHVLSRAGGQKPRSPTALDKGAAGRAPQYRQVVRVLAWQRRATGLAVEADRPGDVLEALGPVPASTAPSLEAASFEADQAALVLPDPDVVVVPIVAIQVS
jgi:hypothetical protein